MRRLIPALAAAFLALPASADQLPSLVPTHDVSGIYLFTNAQGTQTISVEYSKDANVLRIVPQAGAGPALYTGDVYILYDFGANDAKMVLPQMQHYFEQPELVTHMQVVQNDIANSNVNVTAGGQENIAGYACTDYTSGGGSSLCVTPDGVLLKFTASNGDSAVAQSLSYGDVALDDVQLPPGYTQIAPPQLAGAAPP